MSEDEVKRLRQQNHDAAAKRDAEERELRRQVGRYESAHARAKESVRGSPVDWTDSSRAQNPDGWWSYTSQQNRDIIAAAILAAGSGDETLDLLIEARRLFPDLRLMQLLVNALPVKDAGVSGDGYFTSDEQVRQRLQEYIELHRGAHEQMDA